MGLDCMLYGIKENKKKDVLEKSSGIWEEICYWRKANQIHKWFNDRFIKKQNPWGYYEVEEKDIQGLLAMCKLLQYLKNSPDDDNYVMTDWFKFIKKENEREQSNLDCADLIAYALLPPDNLGCFFGSGEVDEWYWEQIDDTIDQLTNALEKNYNKYFYMASW